MTELNHGEGLFEGWRPEERDFMFNLLFGPDPFGDQAGDLQEIEAMHAHFREQREAWQALTPEQRLVEEGERRYRLKELTIKAFPPDGHGKWYIGDVFYRDESEDRDG